MTDRYTMEGIRSAVESDIDRLFAPWAVGRPETWKPDPATKILIALGYWLDEELRKVVTKEEDRRTQLWKYNRLSRTYDIFESAAEIMNEALDGKVEQNRVRHRRWG